MSHTDSPANGDALKFLLLTVVNYTAGGEPVTANDAGVKAVDAVFFGTVPASQNTLAVPLFPLLDGGNIKLFQFVSGSPVEIATKVGLNAVIPCIVHVSLF